jgi:hypothetical protein
MSMVSAEGMMPALNNLKEVREPAKDYVSYG